MESYARAADACSTYSPCIRCAMVIVIRHRFAMFREFFGRVPGPQEPLFFDSRLDHPVQAGAAEIRDQVISAAVAADIAPGPILRFMRLEPGIGPSPRS